MERGLLASLSLSLSPEMRSPQHSSSFSYYSTRSTNNLFWAHYSSAHPTSNRHPILSYSLLTPKAFACREWILIQACKYIVRLGRIQSGNVRGTEPLHRSMSGPVVITLYFTRSLKAFFYASSPAIDDQCDCEALRSRVFDLVLTYSHYTILFPNPRGE